VGRIGKPGQTSVTSKRNSSAETQFTSLAASVKACCVTSRSSCASA